MWELEEDCSNLEALLHRYDSEAELQSHELGRALLHMVRDDVARLPALPSRVHREEPPEVVEDPFLAVREHLAAVDSALKPATEMLQLSFSWLVFVLLCSGATQDMRALLV